MAKFEYSSLYYIRYNAKLKDVLPIWDKKPLMIPLNVGATHTLGLNLHWVPKHLQKKVITFILKQSHSIRSRKKLARITYKALKSTPGLKLAATRGVRLYINSRARIIDRITKDEIHSFFLPLEVQKGFFKRHRAKKVKNEDL